MRVAERLARREASWLELDRLLLRAESAGPRRASPTPGTGPLGAAEVLRLGELYRAACADLMAAEANDLPRETVASLHDLVARGHNAVYRARGFRASTWAEALFVDVPRRLRRDPFLAVAALAFFGTFAVFAVLSAARPGFAADVLGPQMIDGLEKMYAEPPASRGDRDDAMMAGFYVKNNAGIGLQCFAWGLTLGLGTLYVLVTNGQMIGASFGHMAGSPHAGNFFEFVTAHGPFELTAIVFAGAAGLRLGWGLIDHRGASRLDSLRREAAAALPTVGASVLLFVLAAFLEGFVSASPLPYAAKAGIAIVCAALLVVYLGFGGRADRSAGPVGDDR